MSGRERGTREQLALGLANAIRERKTEVRRALELASDALGTEVIDDTFACATALAAKLEKPDQLKLWRLLGYAMNASAQSTGSEWRVVHERDRSAAATAYFQGGKRQRVRSSLNANEARSKKTRSANDTLRDIARELWRAKPHLSSAQVGRAIFAATSPEDKDPKQRSADRIARIVHDLKPREAVNG